MSVRKMLVLFLVIGTFTCGLSITVKRSEILDFNGKYSAEWEADLDTEIIVFTVDVETTGFVGFGISSNPSMAGADIVIGGVRDDQTIYFADYHATSNGFPQRDERQDWELLNATQSGGRTLLRFSRKLSTCDEDGDVAITADTQYLIWAIGDTDDISYHGADPSKRGPKIMNFLDAPKPAVDLTEYETFHIKREYQLLPEDTVYWCTIHKAPNFDGIKHHVVAFNTTLTSQKSIKHSHHVVIHNCEPPAGQSTDFFEQYVDHPGGDCLKENPGIPNLYCTSLLYIWAVGGEALILPEMTGYPIGDSGRQEYLMVTLHVDNPDLETDTFEFGVDLFYTSKLREIDTAVFGVRHAVSHFQTIPPGSDNFVNIGHCSAECTAAYIPAEGMTLTNVMFHAHKAGKKTRTRIIRDGVELPWIAVDNHYNFNYQASRPIRGHRKVLPGDHIITECTYDTSARSNVTIGGHPSMYEMCSTWFWAYPISLRICASTANLDLNEFFGIENYTVSAFEEDPILTKPDAIAGLKYSDYLNTVNWTDDLKNRLQRAQVYGSHELKCNRESTRTTVSYPVITKEYIEENVCGDDRSNSANFVRTFSFVAFLLLILQQILSI